MRSNEPEDIGRNVFYHRLTKAGSEEVAALLKPRWPEALQHAVPPRQCNYPDCKVCHGQTDWSTLE